MPLLRQKTIKIPIKETYFIIKDNNFRCNRTIYQKKESRAPKIVKIKGIFFKIAGANSASRSTKFSKFVVRDVKKNGDPTPINKSLEKKPQKCCQKPKTLKAKS